MIPLVPRVWPAGPHRHAQGLRGFGENLEFGVLSSIRSFSHKTSEPTFEPRKLSNSNKNNAGWPENHPGHALSRPLKTLTILASFCQNKLIHAIVEDLRLCAINLTPRSRSVEASNGKFAPRQRPPFIPVHGQ